MGHGCTGTVTFLQQQWETCGNGVGGHQDAQGGNSGGEMEVWGTALEPRVPVCQPQPLGCHPSLAILVPAFPHLFPKLPTLGLTPCHVCSL